MSDFVQALAVVVSHEVEPGSTDGSYTDRPGDKGGPTKWGITQATLASWRGRPVTAGDVASLEYGEAKEIYRARYWIPLFCQAMGDQTVATKVLDIGVNCGVGSAARMLQQAANRCQPEEIAEDGVVGPATLRAVNRCEPMELVTELCHVQTAHYLAIVERDPAERPNLHDWAKRARWPWTIAPATEATT